jgi:hypothetical protein
VNRALVAAVVLTLAATGAVGLVVRGWTGPAPVATTGEVCAAAAEVLDALGESVSDQVVLRTRAAHLADLLIDRSAQDPDAGSLATARRIVAVLDDPDATVSDLRRVVRPVAEQCPDVRSTR